MNERPTNQAIAEALERAAALLEERGANPHRVQAYRYAADTVRHAERPLADLLEEGGTRALEQLPGVGPSLAARVAGFIETGRLELIQRLREAYAPADLFSRVPGIGRELAERIYAALHVETLEELEMAAHDGRLDAVSGFGPRRVRAVRAQLNAMLSRSTRRHLRRLHRQARSSRAPSRPQQPPIGALLNVDLEYRHRSQRDELERIAPRRFNPSGEVWLPVLHTRRGDWHFTALFSNTARAHALEKTDDWVVLYGEHDGRELQYTVVTETRGDLAGRRVVRGREAECRAYYASHEATAA
jgi:DNA polymerase (family 10)